MTNRLKDTIERWRHTRGYGVHSPLAYRLVKECIRPDARYGFYSDAHTDFAYHEDRRKKKMARMIIRMLNLLRPRRVWIQNADKPLTAAIKSSFPSMTVYACNHCPGNVDFIICDSRQPHELWGKMKNQTECGMLDLQAIEEEEVRSLSPTLTLSGHDFTLMLRREWMSAIIYKI